MRTHGSEELVQRRKQLVPQNYRFRLNDAPHRSKSKTVSPLKLTVLGEMTHPGYQLQMWFLTISNLIPLLAFNPPLNWNLKIPKLLVEVG